MRKLVAGRRRAREAKQTGSASDAPGAGWKSPGAPRLVKKTPALAGAATTEN